MGDILYDDLLYILPFENTVDLVTMRGSGLRNALEKACYNINPGSTPQSAEALAAMEKWKANLTEFQEVLGTNEVLLEERGASEESNIGDVICDAFAAAHNNTRF